MHVFTNTPTSSISTVSLAVRPRGLFFALLLGSLLSVVIALAMPSLARAAQTDRGCTISPTLDRAESGALHSLNGYRRSRGVPAYQHGTALDQAATQILAQLCAQDVEDDPQVPDSSWQLLVPEAGSWGWVAQPEDYRTADWPMSIIRGQNEAAWTKYLLSDQHDSIGLAGNGTYLVMVTARCTGSTTNCGLDSAQGQRFDPQQEDASNQDQEQELERGGTPRARASRLRVQDLHRNRKARTVTIRIKLARGAGIVSLAGDKRLVKQVRPFRLRSGGSRTITLRKIPRGAHTVTFRLKPSAGWSRTSSKIRFRL